MTLHEQFISDVLSKIPHGPWREQIEMDLRAHIAERLDAGQTIEEAIRQFGDPQTLADSYLSSIPLVSASFMSRTAAKLIDFPAILISGCLVLWVAWQVVMPSSRPFIPNILHPNNPVMMTICVCVVALLFPGYFILGEFMTDTTLGKQVMGLRVVRESGARISLGQSVVRQLPLIGSFFLLDALFALFTEKNQRAFELITKTRVVRND